MNRILVVGVADPSDDVLIANIACGDREAFAEFYRRHRAAVCRFAAHMCGSTTAAEDIVHEAFVAVMDSASRYRPGQSTGRLWLFGIARNYVRRARSVRTMLSLDDEAPSGDRALTVATDPVGDIERRRHLQALRRAILALPARYREAVVLCDLQELSYVDAATALGCAIGTIRSRLHRGRAMLARQLCGQMGHAAGPEPVEGCPMPVTRTMS